MLFFPTIWQDKVLPLFGDGMILSANLKHSYLTILKEVKITTFAKLILLTTGSLFGISLKIFWKVKKETHFFLLECGKPALFQHWETILESYYEKLFRQKHWGSLLSVVIVTEKNVPIFTHQKEFSVTFFTFT
ncbi:hypothetical protein SDC9_189001 [bioreactor metagenome]|uniref:Uncharacterized protein n=1 Tax=bioreactor metagenome TaxID=1076179 RepID=A0A645HQW4_9ZZZZ